MSMMRPYGLYDICKTYTPGTTTANCLLRGIGGDYSRVTADASWKRKIIDPIGEVWTPFAFARVNGQSSISTTPNSYTIQRPRPGTSTFSNAIADEFRRLSNAGYGYAMPGAGLEYRYPMTTTVARRHLRRRADRADHRPAQCTVGNHVDGQHGRAKPRLRRHDLVRMGQIFGLRPVRDGRAGQLWRAGHARLQQRRLCERHGGQSVQVAGTNSYATPDAANVGLSSGLDTPWSDYVAAFTFVPSSILSFTAKGRFDQATLDPRRIDSDRQYKSRCLDGRSSICGLRGAAAARLFGPPPRHSA